MRPSRRHVLSFAVVATALSAGLRLPARAATPHDVPVSDALYRAVMAFTRGRAPVAGGLSLTVSGVADGLVRVALGPDEAAETMLLLAAHREAPSLGRFGFGPSTTGRRVVAAVPLAPGERLVALARHADGTCRVTAAEVGAQAVEGRAEAVPARLFEASGPPASTAPGPLPDLGVPLPPRKPARL